MYTVLYHIPENTAELQDWLNERSNEGLFLVTADNHYWVFERISVFPDPLKKEMDVLSGYKEKTVFDELMHQLNLMENNGVDPYYWEKR